MKNKKIKFFAMSQTQNLPTFSLKCNKKWHGTHVIYKLKVVVIHRKDYKKN